MLPVLEELLSGKLPIEEYAAAQRPRKRRNRSLRAKYLPKLAARDGLRCRRCGRSDNLSIDHVRPRSRGGKDRLENLQILCVPCNQEKADAY